MAQATMTQARVQNQRGQPLGLDQVKSIKLADGQWHPAQDCQITYRDARGQQQTASLNDIQGFSEEVSPNPST